MASRQPRKQRRRMYRSPLHRRGRLVRVHLSSKYLEDTKVSYPRSLPVRQGDTVQIMRGTHRGQEGKVTRVDRRRFHVYVDGITVAKADGTEVGRPVHPSNLRISRLDMTDPWRRRLVERSGGRP